MHINKAEQGGNDITIGYKLLCFRVRFQLVEIDHYLANRPRIESPLSTLISCGASVERCFGANTTTMVTLNEPPPRLSSALPSAPFAAHQHALRPRVLAPPRRGANPAGYTGFRHDPPISLWRTQSGPILAIGMAKDVRRIPPPPLPNCSREDGQPERGGDRRTWGSNGSDRNTPPATASSSGLEWGAVRSEAGNRVCSTNPRHSGGVWVRMLPGSAGRTVGQLTRRPPSPVGCHPAPTQSSPVPPLPHCGRRRRGG